MECEMPQINSNDDEIIEYFKETKTIAVLGVSPNEEKPSHRVAKYLRDVGYKMIPVYPKEDNILDQKVYRSLLDIDERVDMVVVFRKPDAITAIADDCISRGDIKVLWTQIGLVNNKAAQTAKDANINVVQNLCAMIEHKKLLGFI